MTQPEEEDADSQGPASHVEQRRDEGVSTGEASAVEFTDQNGASRAVAVRPSDDVEPPENKVCWQHF